MEPGDKSLKEALASLTVRAWRLHLDTPGVEATVPMIRGVWGASLKSLSELWYRRIFTGGEAGIPRYIMRPAPPDAFPTPAIEFLLFGRPNDQADEMVWSAWQRACALGLGRERQPFFIERICALAWDGTSLAATRVQPGFVLHPLPWPAGEVGNACRLDFPVPLRIMRDGELVSAPTLPDVTIAALRRTCALAPSAGDELWPHRFEWLDVARRINAHPWSGRRLDLIRYSGSQHREIELAGVAGALALPEGPGPLAPLLAAATWLHLGKGTVIGLGQMCVRPEQEGGSMTHSK